jgi:RHS repeat-associated protein
LSYGADPANPALLKKYEENNYYPFGLKHKEYNNALRIIVKAEPVEAIASGKKIAIFQTDPLKPITTISNSSYNYKYNGKEYQDELGLNMYDYGARNYDPSLGRWMNIDPMAETYYTVSSYVYVANNPLLFIDPTGMKIEDPDKIVEKQKSMLNSTITEIKSFIKNGALGEELGNKLIGVNETNLNEISDMEKSDQVYNVYTNNDNTGVSYDKATDKVMIGLNAKDDYGLIGHELKHGYQFEKGKVSLMADNSSYGSLYDVSDETEAYNRDRQLNGGRDYFENPSSLVWKNEDVLNLGKTMVPPAYQGLPTGPININSKEGKALRNKTIEAGKNGQTVQEVYKGWQKDYAKGTKTKG